MSSFSALKTAIQAAIKQNGNNAITGDILQEILLSIVSTLGDNAINNLETGLQTESQTRGNDDAALSQAIENEATARGNQDTQLGNLITGIKNNIDNGYVYAGIATPSTTPAGGKVFYIATQAGTYTNLGNTAVKPGISILKYNGSAWSNEQVIYTDGGVFDVSAYNGGATYASLEALLSDANLSTIIPSAVRKGGMSVKFVQSSDNNYVQFRCIADEFTTNIAYWIKQDANHIIKITIFADSRSGLSVGDIYYNTTEKELRIITGPASAHYEVIPFNDGTIYVYQNELYCWNGNDMVQTTVAEQIAASSSGTNVWNFNYKINSGTQYKVCLLSGDEGYLYSVATTYTLLKKNEWVTVESTTNGNIGIRTPYGVSVQNAPTLVIINQNNALNGMLDNILQINSFVGDEKIAKITASSSSGTRFWNFNYQIKSGQKYAITLIDGDEGLLTGNSVSYSPCLTKGSWAIIEPQSDDSLFLKIGSSSTLTNAPTIGITSVDNTLLTVVGTINNLTPVQEVLFNKEATTKGAYYIQLAKSVVSAHVWGITNGREIGLASIGNLGTDRKQLYFYVADNEGNLHGIYYNISNSVINQNGATYIVIYKDEWYFYPTYADRSILPSELRIAIDFSKLTLPIGGYNQTYYVPFSARVCDSFENPYTLLNNQNSVIYITCKRSGTNGVDADFCGLNAIGDAISSITDASEMKRYCIVIDGHFRFSNPQLVENGGDFKYVIDGEPTVLWSKDFVEFMGIDHHSAVIEVSLDASLQEEDFPIIDGTRKSFMDYQPVFVRTNSHICNLIAISQNSRYTIHIETTSGSNGSKIDFEYCTFIKKLSTKGSMSVFIMGEIAYFQLNVEDCVFINENTNGGLIAGHTPLRNVIDGRENCIVKITNCDFRTQGYINLQPFTYNRQDVHVFEGCKFHPLINITDFCNATSKRPLGTFPVRNFSNSAMPFSLDYATACGLRIKTISGEPSSVRFDPTCSAFGIIGNADENTVYELPYSAIKTYGYEYKDDANGSHAYACGWVNIDPTTGNSLGAILGDCSGTSKTLKVTINGTEYSIVFNTNLTNASNADIIALIDNVIGEVAVCDTFNPESLHYPAFDGEEYYISNSDTVVIEKGMGIVKTSESSIRLAKQSDGHIDGVAIDVMYPGQKGRIITSGIIHNNSSSQAYSVYPYINSLSYGDKLSIDPNNDGCFIKSNAAPVLKCIGGGFVKFV